MMQINPYLTFSGNCAAAFKFYETVLGGTGLAMMTHGDSPMSSEMPPDWANAIMHAQMTVGDIQLMGSDTPPQFYQKPAGSWVSVSITEAAEADRIFEALSENGSISMPIAETFWAHRFGMLTDQFGTPWMINCYKPMGG